MPPPRPPSNAALVEQACEVMPGGVNSAARQFAPHVVFREAQGPYLTDADGRRYVDYHLAFGPVLLGHNHPAVNRSVAEALQGAPLSGAGVTELEIEVARKIRRHVPCAEKVLLCTSGSEAVSSAIHVARAFTCRPKIIKFQGSYHGIYDSVLTGGFNAAAAAAAAKSLAGGILPGVAENTLVATYNSLDEVEQLLARHPQAVAAIIVEPIGHSLGCILPKPGFLEGLRELSRAYGALLIFDEVITGFRHHLSGYQAICGVCPDLATFGKAIANGFPLAAVAGRADIMDRFSTHPGGDTTFAGTFHGHPVGCAAALATIELLERESVHEYLFRLGDRLRRGLAEIHAKLGTGATVAGFGSVFITYFAEGPFENHADAMRNNAAKFVEYRRRLIERGIFLMPVNLKRGHISYSHTEQDIDGTLDIIESTLTPERELAG